MRERLGAAALLVLAACAVPAAVHAQRPPAATAGGAGAPAELAAERRAWAAFLVQSPMSPLAARVHQPVGRQLVLGPADADVPLPGLARHVLREDRGALTLETPAGPRPVPRGRSVPLGGWRLVASGQAGRTVATIFGAHATAKPAPEYFAYAKAMVFDVRLEPPAAPASLRLLGPDGLETEAREAGTIVVPLGPAPGTRLVVRRLAAADDEDELLVFVRDGTSGAGSYPAGRFVTLVPLPGGRVRVDFNRARNPWCAYNGIFPCPAPWRGNTLPVPVPAGERYADDGTLRPAVPPEEK